MFFLALLIGTNLPAAEFIELFEGDVLHHDPTSRDGWAWMTGDGEAEITFSQAGGAGILQVDARGDRHNVWWAVIRRSISNDIDTRSLSRPDRELRVQAKIRSSAAPRRVNLHFNHSRTTDFHSHLMEFDIPRAEEWHTISMTTHGFDVESGDEVFVQMALMDWGRGQFRVDIDYMEVSVVDPETAGPDLGEPLPYRPTLPPIETFANRIGALQDATVDPYWVSMNFKSWSNEDRASPYPLIFAGGPKLILLRWNLEDFSDRNPRDWGVLELTTDQVFRAHSEIEELDELRVVEILGGDPDWDRETITWNRFSAGHDSGALLNSQMMVDFSPVIRRGAKTHIAVSPPVLRRLFSGQTRGLAIQAQGGIQATFFSTASGNSDGPTLYFNLD